MYHKTLDLAYQCTRGNYTFYLLVKAYTFYDILKSKYLGLLCIVLIDEYRVF